MIDILKQDGIPVIPVNVNGAMGAGLALQAKRQIPWAEAVYRLACYRGALTLNHPVYIATEVAEGDLPTPPNIKGVILFPTKQHWRQKSKYSYVENGMRNLATLIRNSDDLYNTPIWVPPLGCGLGGLDEGPVYAAFQTFLSIFPRTHYIGSDGTEWEGMTPLREGVA